MPLQINLSDYGQNSLSNLANIAGSMNGEVKPGAGIRDRAMIGDVGANRVGGPFGRNGADGTSGAAQYLTDPNQFSTWRPSEGAAYQNATGMRDAVLAVGKNPAAFDSLNPQMQQNMLASLAAARGIYGTGELRGISGGSTFYSVIDMLSPNRTAEHEARGARSGVNVGGNTFYGNDPEMSARVAQGIKDFDYKGAISAAANNLPQSVATAYRNFQPDLFKPLGQGFNPDSPTNPGVPDARGDGTIGDANFGGGITPLDYDTVRNPANQIAYIPEGGPPGRPDGIVPEAHPLDAFSDAITHGVEGGINAVGGAAKGVGDFLGGVLKGRFDGAAYDAANPDVAASGMDPLTHFLTYGYDEGRSLDTQGDKINQGFNPSAYLAANPDVAASGANPLLHYLQYGAHEGRAADFSGNTAPGNFGTGIYQPAGIDTLGLGSVAAPAPITADFSGSPLSPIDPGNPIATPAPITADFGSPLAPVPTGPNVSQGVAPGTFQGTFNGADYLAANQDLAGFNVDPLQHYLTYGYQEGRALDLAGDRIGQGFDPSQYLQANPDVAASGVSPLQHYLQYGAHEGRATDFSGGVAPASFGAGITPNAPAPSATGFSASNVSQGVDPGSFRGTFNGADYLAANQDLAGFNIDPLQHYLTYGYQEGRALDTAGDRINQGFDPSAYLQANPDVAATGLGALQHYIMAGAHEGRATNFSGGVAPGSFGSGIVPAPSMQSPMDLGAFGSIDTPAPIAGGNFGADLSPVSTGPNVSAGVGNGTFRGTFNGADYLAANPDVAAAHVDPLQHYLTSGYNEGRALNVQGDRINQGFNPSQYFNANPDAAASGVSALQHYIQYGAHEGRAADFSGGVSPGNFGAGITPYAPAPGPMDFSGSNVGQGLGPTGNGGFGLPQSAPSVPDFGAGYNVSGGVQNGGFGLGGVMSGNYGGGFNPYGFSGANVVGGLGAQPQSMGGYYPAGNTQGGGLDPYGFSQANVGGFDANSFGGDAPVEDFGSGAGLGPTQWNDAPSGGGAQVDAGTAGFNPEASELAFLRGQLDQQYAANARLADSANAGINFANQGAAQANQLNAVGGANAAKQFAGIQAGLGIAPVPGTSFAPAPVGIQTIGGIGPSNFGMAGLGGAPLRGFF